MYRRFTNALKIGDTVYSAANGQPMKITAIYEHGIDTDVDYFGFDEHRKLFWLTKAGYKQRLEIENDG
jgi:hypothetical protein